MYKTKKEKDKKEYQQYNKKIREKNEIIHKYRKYE